MGRGVSDLQRDILERAGKLQRVYYADVLIGFFAWKPRRSIRRYTANDQGAKALGVGTIRSPETKIFEPGRIGEAKYRSTMASLSRAVSRLADRGLVFPLRGGLEITEAGREWLRSREPEPSNLPD